MTDQEPDYKNIAEAIFGLEDGEKVDKVWDLETELPLLEAFLSESSCKFTNEYNIHPEVSKFITGLYDYVENNIVNK
jgi:hypothetical protein